jgi:hypothetical protein
MNISNKIIDYENGKMTDKEVVEFFQYLIDSKMLYNLQGHYQRIARFFLEEGLCENR